MEREMGLEPVTFSQRTIPLFLSSLSIFSTLPPFTRRRPNNRSGKVLKCLPAQVIDLDKFDLLSRKKAHGL